MTDDLEMRCYLLNREIQYWVDQGRDRSSNRLCDLPSGSREAREEEAWQRHCLARLNAAAWELADLEGRDREDATVTDLAQWRYRDD